MGQKRARCCSSPPELDGIQARLEVLTHPTLLVVDEIGYPGLVACPGGPLRLPDGREAIKALTWKEVSDSVEQFSSLNPPDREVVPGSVLKIEDDNFDPETKTQRQLYCYAISSKRYALFVRDSDGTPTLTKWSKHGLGHLSNPTDLDDDDRAWIPKVWRASHSASNSSVQLPSDVPRSRIRPSVRR